jgi:hypothetical protein
MSVAKTLQRLFHIRRLEEDQRRGTLEAAVAKLNLLVHAREQAAEMEIEGRAHMVEGAASGELVDRVAGLVQTDVARRRRQMLVPRIASAEAHAADCRREFLEKRVQRKQTEALIEEATARHELESERRSQRNLDDWFGARMHRQTNDEEPPRQ